MNPSETPIFPMSTPPMREGIYKIHLNKPCGKTYFALWENKQWHSWQETAFLASKIKFRSSLCYDDFYAKGWSGLIHPTT